MHIVIRSALSSHPGTRGPTRVRCAALAAARCALATWTDGGDANRSCVYCVLCELNSATRVYYSAESCFSPDMLRSLKSGSELATVYRSCEITAPRARNPIHYLSIGIWVQRALEFIALRGWSYAIFRLASQEETGAS